LLSSPSSPSYLSYPSYPSYPSYLSYYLSMLALLIVSLISFQSGGAPVVIVAMGDSTTAGTPAFKSPIEAPPDGSGNEQSQYAYWLVDQHRE